MLKTIPFKNINFLSPPKTKAIILDFNNYNFILQQFYNSIVIPSSDKNYSEQEEENLFLDWITNQVDFDLLKIFVEKPKSSEFIDVNYHFVEFMNIIGDLKEPNIKEKFNINYDQKDLNYIAKNRHITDFINFYKTNLKTKNVIPLLDVKTLSTVIFNEDVFFRSDTKINKIEILKLILCYVPIHDLTNIITHRILSEI